MRIRVLELPTQIDGDQSYRTPWILVIDDLPDPKLVGDNIQELARLFGAEGALVVSQRVELGEDVGR